MQISPEEDPRQRTWFKKGKRHGLQNRVADLEKILPRIPSLDTLTAIDIGAAEGDIGAWLAARYRHVHAIEAMQLVFNHLSEKAKAIPNMNCEQADIRFFTPARLFDHVFLLGVLHYFDDDSIKESVLVKCLTFAQSLCFVRTGIREQKAKYGFDQHRVHKYVPISVLHHAAEAMDFDAALIDNALRGRGEERLGDLIVFRKRDIGLPALPDLLSGVDAPILYLNQQR